MLLLASEIVYCRLPLHPTMCCMSFNVGHFINSFPNRLKSLLFFLNDILFFFTYVPTCYATHRPGTPCACSPGYAYTRYFHLNSAFGGMNYRGLASMSSDKPPKKSVVSPYHSVRQSFHFFLVIPLWQNRISLSGPCSCSSVVLESSLDLARFTRS